MLSVLAQKNEEEQSFTPQKHKGQQCGALETPTSATKAHHLKMSHLSRMKKQHNHTETPLQPDYNITSRTFQRKKNGKIIKIYNSQRCGRGKVELASCICGLFAFYLIC